MNVKIEILIPGVAEDNLTETERAGVLADPILKGVRRLHEDATFTVEWEPDTVHTHDWKVVMAIDDRPGGIECSGCGQSWALAKVPEGGSLWRRLGR